MAPTDGIAAQGIGENYEQQFATFRQIARNFFKNYVRINNDYLDFIKAVTRYYSIDLPQDINEYLITVDTAPYFWITDIPLITKTEEFFNKLYKAGGGPSNYEELKKYYTRWITQKNTRDKQFYTLSAINLLEKDQIKSHFYKKVLHANLLMFNANVLAFDKALKLLDDADKILEASKLNPKFKNELKYLLQLYTGFAQFRGENFEQAQREFENAIFVKSSGVSAIFYNAVTNAKLANYDSAINLLSHVIDYDKARFRFALNKRSLPLIEFFLRNAVTYNIFNEPTFVPMVADLEELIAYSLAFDISKLKQVLINLAQIETLKLEKYYDDFINKHIEFLKLVSGHYKDSSNALASLIAQFTVEEYNNILDRIIENARKIYREVSEKKAEIYDKQIKENKKKIKNLQEDIESYTEKINEKMEKTLEDLEEEVEKITKRIEHKIDHIEDTAKYNPTVSFKNSMIYNGIISMIVFMITGFSSGFLNNVANYDNFSLVITSFLLAGFKWGGLSYLIGILVSLFSAASTMMERGSQKQRLMKQLAYVKNLGEKRKEALKRGFQKEIEQHRKKIEEKIQSIQEDIESLEEEKLEEQDSMNTDIEQKVSELKQKLSPYFL